MLLSLFHMKYNLAINHSTGSDPDSTIGADNKLFFVQTASSFLVVYFPYSLLYDYLQNLTFLYIFYKYSPFVLQSRFFSGIMQLLNRNIAILYATNGILSRKKSETYFP